MNKARMGNPHTYMYSVEQVSVSKRPSNPAMNDMSHLSDSLAIQHPNIKVTFKKSMNATNDV